MKKVIKTGFEELDNHFIDGGLTDDSLTLIASRPAMGKSTFALHIINNNIDDKSIAFFTYDMPENKVINRLKDLFNIDISDKKLKLYEKSDTVDDIINKCIELKDSDDGLDLVIIDYIQLVNSNISTVRDRELKSDILRKLKDFTVKYNVAVIVFSQLCRYNDSLIQPPTIENINLDEDVYYSLSNIMYLFNKSNEIKPTNTIELGVLKSRHCEPIKINIEMKFI